MSIPSIPKFRLHRFLSAFVDVIIFQAAGFVIVMISYLLIPSSIFPLYPLPYLLFLNKDFLNGRGLGKRLFKHGVVDCHSRQPASIWQCFIRNLLLPFLIIEPLAMLVNPKRRLGDLIAGTEIEVVQINTSLQDELYAFQAWWQLVLSSLLSILYLILLIVLVQFGTLLLV